MEPMPDYSQPFPPTPPPPLKPSHKGLWISLGIAVVLLCLCCIVLIAGVYLFQRNIPVISNFFPTPTPAGLPYSNPTAGISLAYPPTWKYSESGDATNGFTIIFASSADILNDSTNAPQTGAALAIMTNLMTTSDVTFPVDANSLGSVVDYIASMYFSNIRGGQNMHTFVLNGNPAASAEYAMTNSSGSDSTAYLTGILRNEEIIVIVAVCSQPEWAQFHPVFDSIINSLVIVTP